MRYLTWLAAASIIGFALIIFALHIRRDGLVDDAFITYRYAARLATGAGLTYNDNEKVLGSSTPGYAILLALPASIIGSEHIPLISLTVSVIATFIMMVSVACIAFHLCKNLIVAVLATLLAMTSHYTAWVIATGMEAPVFLALLSMGVLALLHQRWMPTVIIFSFLPLIRPEGIFPVAFVGLTLLAYYYNQRERLTVIWLIRSMALLLLPGLLYLLVATAYYGTPIPQSIVAKSAGLYPLDSAVTERLIIIRLREFLIPFVRPFGDFTSPRRSILLAGISLGIMFAGGIWMIQRQAWLWIVPATLMILLAFYAHSATLLFGWYYAHFDALAVLCFATGLYALTVAIMKRVWKAVPNWLPFIISISLFLYLQHSVILENAVLPNSAIHQPPLGDREYDYYQLTQWLGTELPEGTTVAMPEVGVLGYYLPHVTVLDAAGLVSPQAVTYFPIPESERLAPDVGAIPRGLIHDYQPDMVITLDFFVAKGLLIDDWFLENYTLVYQTADLTIEHGELLVYARNDFTSGLSLHHP